MKMTVHMKRKEAEDLLKAALRPKLGDVEFRVKQIDWRPYSSDIEFELESEEPAIEPAPLAPPADPTEEN